MKLAGAPAPRVLWPHSGRRCSSSPVSWRMGRPCGWSGRGRWLITSCPRSPPRLTPRGAGPEIQVGLPVCVTDDPVTARQEAAAEFGFYNDLPSYRAMLDREGADQPADLAVIGGEAVVNSALGQIADLGATSLSAQLFGTAAEQMRTLELFAELGGAWNPTIRLPSLLGAEPAEQPLFRGGQSSYRFWWVRGSDPSERRWCEAAAMVGLCP